MLQTRPQTAQDYVQAIEVAVNRSPTEILSRKLGIARTTVWRTLRYKLMILISKKLPYHIQVIHHLEREDPAAREPMCVDLQESAANENLIQNVLFSNEATFYTCESVRIHSCRIWVYQQPNQINKWKIDTPKVNV